MATGDPFPWELRPDGLWGFVLSDSSHGFGFLGVRLKKSSTGPSVSSSELQSFRQHVQNLQSKTMELKIQIAGPLTSCAF